MSMRLRDGETRMVVNYLVRWKAAYNLQLEASEEEMARLTLCNMRSEWIVGLGQDSTMKSPLNLGRAIQAIFGNLGLMIGRNYTS